MTGTTCQADHHRQSLCCKSGAEYDQYYAERERDSGYRYVYLHSFLTAWPNALSRSFTRGKESGNHG